METQYNNNYYPQQEEYDEIDIMELIRKFCKEWKLAAKWCAVAAVVGVIIALSVVSTYTVDTQLTPESSSKSGSSSLGSLSSLASLAGVNLGSMSSSDAISPDLYPQVVSSVPFLSDLFSVPVEFERKGETVRATYYDYLRYYQKKYKFSIGVSKKDKEPEEAMVNVSMLTRPQNEVIKAMRKRIALTVDKKTSVIKLSVTDQDPEIANQIAKTVVSNLKAYISSYRTEKVRHDLAYYEKLYNESQTSYFEAQQKYAQYVDANQGVVRQSAMAEQARLQDEMKLQYSLYNTWAQQVQTAKAQVQHETPVFVTITPPSVPLDDNESGAKICFTSVLIGFILSALWILWGRDALAKLKEDPEAESEQEKKGDAKAEKR